MAQARSATRSDADTGVGLAFVSGVWEREARCAAECGDGDLREVVEAVCVGVDERD